MFAPFEHVHVCHSCASVVGGLAEDPNDVLGAWHEREALSSSAAEVETRDADRVFEEFKKGVARVISADDCRSHLHLAEAYVEMRLLVDARREAGIAAQGAITEVIVEALRILLSEPLLRDDGIARLRARVFGSALS